MVNLLIGPNNTGKSNLGRFLIRVRDILVGYRLTQPWVEGVAWRAPLRVEFLPSDEVDHWMRDSAPVVAELELRSEALGSPAALPAFCVRDGNVRVRLTLTRDGSNGVLSVVPLSTSGAPLLVDDAGTHKLMHEDASYTETVTTAHTHRGLAVAVCRCLATMVLEIRPMRNPARAPHNPKELSTDGGEIVAQLRACQGDINQQQFWAKCRRDIRRWLETLLGEEDVAFEINDSGFWVELRRGDGELRCALPDLGAGVAEMVMLLAYLRLRPNSPYLVVVDEPEAHLHPGAVVEMVRIVTGNMPNHQLLITTHSTALMDAVSNDWRTYRVHRGPWGGTAVEALDTNLAKLNLLADLGVRPSQLFLARVALWVEGPSDIHYWTALLREVEPTLVVGRDFGFVPYGGASASHLSFGFGDDEDDVESQVEALVEVLSISHRAAIICDRDRAEGEDERKLVALLCRGSA